MTFTLQASEAITPITPSGHLAFDREVSDLNQQISDLDRYLAQAPNFALDLNQLGTTDNSALPEWANDAFGTFDTVSTVNTVLKAAFVEQMDEAAVTMKILSTAVDIVLAPVNTVIAMGAEIDEKGGILPLAAMEAGYQHRPSDVPSGSTVIAKTVDEHIVQPYEEIKDKVAGHWEKHGGYPKERGKELFGDTVKVAAFALPLAAAKVTRATRFGKTAELRFMREPPLLPPPRNFPPQNPTILLEGPSSVPLLPAPGLRPPAGGLLYQGQPPLLLEKLPPFVPAPELLPETLSNLKINVPSQKGPQGFLTGCSAMDPKGNLHIFVDLLAQGEKHAPTILTEKPSQGIFFGTLNTLEKYALDQGATEKVFIQWDPMNPRIVDIAKGSKRFTYLGESPHWFPETPGKIETHPVFEFHIQQLETPKKEVVREADGIQGVFEFYTQTKKNGDLQLTIKPIGSEESLSRQYFTAMRSMEQVARKHDVKGRILVQVDYNTPLDKIFGSEANNRFTYWGGTPSWLNPEEVEILRTYQFHPSVPKEVPGEVVSLKPVRSLKGDPSISTAKQREEFRKFFGPEKRDESTVEHFRKLEKQKEKQPAGVVPFPERNQTSAFSKTAAEVVELRPVEHPSRKSRVPDTYFERTYPIRNFLGDVGELIMVSELQEDRTLLIFIHHLGPPPKLNQVLNQIVYSGDSIVAFATQAQADLIENALAHNAKKLHVMWNSETITADDLAKWMPIHELPPRFLGREQAWFSHLDIFKTYPVFEYPLKSREYAGPLSFGESIMVDDTQDLIVQTQDELSVVFQYTINNALVCWIKSADPKYGYSELKGYGIVSSLSLRNCRTPRIIKSGYHVLHGDERVLLGISHLEGQPVSEIFDDLVVEMANKGENLAYRIGRALAEPTLYSENPNALVPHTYLDFYITVVESDMEFLVRDGHAVAEIQQMLEEVKANPGPASICLSDPLFEHFLDVAGVPIGLINLTKFQMGMPAIGYYQVIELFRDLAKEKPDLSDLILNRMIPAFERGWKEVNSTPFTPAAEKFAKFFAEQH
jgi:hypothetical protein